MPVCRISLKDSSIMYDELLSDHPTFPGSAKAILLNGRGINQCSDHGTSQLRISCASTASAPAVISVPYSVDLRLRLIGSQTLSYTSIGILGHASTNLGDFSLIAADGTYINPISNLSFIEIAPGQRYDVLFRSKSAAEVEQIGQTGCYWIRMESRWRDPPSGGWGILAYPSCTSIVLESFTSNGPPIPAQTSNANATLLPPAQLGWITSQMSPLFWYGAGLTYLAPASTLR